MSIDTHTPFNKNKKVIKKRRERENGAAPCRVALNSDRENIEQREKKEQEREREAFHAFDGAQKGNAEHEMPFVSEKCQMFMYTFTAHKSKPFRALITIKLNCKKQIKFYLKRWEFILSSKQGEYYIQMALICIFLKLNW